MMVANTPRLVSGSSTLRHAVYCVHPVRSTTSGSTLSSPSPKHFGHLVISIKMSNNNAHESTPLLRGNDGAEESGDAHTPSTWQRAKSWISSHTVNLVLTALLAVFVVLFLVTAFIQTSGGGDEETPPSEPTPGEGAEICTSAGCVLAASTLLRSISSRWALPQRNIHLTPCALTTTPDTRILTPVTTSAHMFVRVSMPSTRSGKTKPALAASRS